MKDVRRLEALQFMAAVEVDGMLYFSLLYANGLFRRDMKTGEIKYIGSVKEERVKKRLHSHAFTYENKVYFIPNTGNYIARLDVNDLSIRAIGIPNFKGRGMKFASCVQAEDALWLVPFAYDALLKVDLKTDEVTQYTNWPSELKDDVGARILFCGGAYVSGVIYLAPYDCEYLVRYDIATNEMKCEKWNYPKCVFGYMIYEKNALWFLPDSGYSYITKYELDNQTFTTIELKEQFMNDSKVTHVTADVLEGKIVFAPYQSEMWTLVDCESGQMCQIKDVIEEAADAKDFPLYLGICRCGDGALVSGDSGKVVLLHRDMQTLQELKFSLSEEQEIRFLKELINQSSDVETGWQAFFSEEDFSLGAYLESLLALEDVNDKRAKNIGSRIYQSLLMEEC